MDLTFANPWGFYALLAIPAVLAIHFLQRESRRVFTSTFFLFEQLPPVSAAGRRFERLRNSLPLILQLVAVLLLAWLLVGPRWVRKDSVQRVVIVLDSSVSMRAFRDDATRALADRLPRLARTAGTTEWRVFETDPDRPTLYAGTDLHAALASLTRWQPRLGTHDFTPALRTAQGLARESGVALLVTGRRAELPDGVLTLAVGRPLDNCGFAGVAVEADAWHALVTAHLTWNGLLVRDTPSLPRQPGDDVLLWLGERPLVFLRGGEKTRILFINFDLRQSNADRLPGFVVLLNRFVESIRADKVAPERLNLETNERLTVAADPTKEPLTTTADGPAGRAPSEPGFFTVSQGTVPLLAGAASFCRSAPGGFP